MPTKNTNKRWMYTSGGNHLSLRRRIAKRKKAAMAMLLSMPMPALDLEKIRAAMLDHDKNCTLCHCIFCRRA